MNTFEPNGNDNELALRLRIVCGSHGRKKLDQQYKKTCVDTPLDQPCTAYLPPVSGGMLPPALHICSNQPQTCHLVGSRACPQKVGSRQITSIRYIVVLSVTSIHETYSRDTLQMYTNGTFYMYVHVYASCSTCSTLLPTK